MSLVSKSKKGSRGMNVKSFEDRLTNLPNCLITKILSCLPTQEAVATSVLSTNWKRTWMSVTNLDFDDKLPTDSYDSDRDTPILRKFKAFVTRVLLLRERSCLKRLRIKCYCDYDDSLVNSWLVALLPCNVEELDISVYIEPPGLLIPSDIFLCSTLVVLKLDVIGYVNMTTSACLPRLRTLHIDGVELSNDESVNSLLSGCPMLEELTLGRCVGIDVRVVKITSHILKRLTIRYLPWSTPDSKGDVKYEIRINTPRLECFSFCDHLAQRYVVSTMKDLAKADISFDCTYTDLNEVQNVTLEDITGFLNGVSHVENLVLSSLAMELFSVCYPLPLFSKLTYLEVDTTVEVESYILSELIGNSPYLKTFHLLQGPGCFDVSSFLPVPPSCFLLYLKVIEIESFEHSDGEMKMVEYFLKNAKVLERLTLHLLCGVEEEFYRELLSLPRASAICKVIVL